jgi:putative nucleotidyltransferase with HDIG domain
VARSATRGAFVPDERGLLLGFARSTAVALQKLVLRERIDRNLVDTIAAFVNIIESKDRYLRGHSARVALYAAEVASALRLSPEQTHVVYRGAMLHDLGKLSIMEAILRKPARLTAEEFAMIKAHPVIGAQILAPVRFLSRETGAVRHHHERFDGAGYPDGLRGEDIPLVARVVTVADVFDAITSDRPYRTALPLDEARLEIARGRGSHFDPDVVDAFMALPLARLTTIARHDGRRLEGPGHLAPAAAGPDRTP